MRSQSARRHPNTWPGPHAWLPRRLASMAWEQRPSLTLLPRPAGGGGRGGEAGQQEGGGEHEGGNPEAMQDADAVAEETNHWRPGEEGNVADGGGRAHPGGRVGGVGGRGPKGAREP